MKLQELFAALDAAIADVQEKEAAAGVLERDGAAALEQLDADYQAATAKVRATVAEGKKAHADALAHAQQLQKDFEARTSGLLNSGRVRTSS